MRKYVKFCDLPFNIQSIINKIEDKDVESWINQKIPALDNFSIMEVMNMNDGKVKVLEYLKKIEGYFMCENLRTGD